LNDLRRVLAFVEIDGQEYIVGMHSHGWCLAGFEKERDVLHLDKGHGGGFVSGSRRNGESYKSVDSISALPATNSHKLMGHALAENHSIFESVQEVSGRQLLAKGFLDPVTNFIGCLRRVLGHAQVSQILVERGYRRHGVRCLYQEFRYNVFWEMCLGVVD
jgi:hypothetical protein